MTALKSQIEWLKSLEHYPEMAFVLGRYDDTKDYVGPEGSSLSRLIPRKFHGVDINVAAYVHDYYYNTGGNSEDRFKADCVFLIDILTQIQITPNTWPCFNWLRRMKAQKSALRYYQAVRSFGKSSFNLRGE